ncbi:NAD(P)H-dependent glycerol-3-phosphate dehydrogenase [Geoalkalibacter subterraneus]|uniref:Glycerol-3-phosphate dehydrogenase [NAD(P)+] n=1 Tax=Geoalkalibacter subterraneus TaxID=483547 RepID=A0A0B5FAV5_9BACT|nr:NAD(P)H-dependent glycerol-3-phosphate dehydrogenase [Geoalkalibacter subterraneus]AJF05297.1 glycerol-3-phosphate dehydrogenase [Geoalkalibacter subterraneus]
MNIAVIGAGSWGTTLADLLARKGYQVTLWAYEADLVERMSANRVNDLYLPGTVLHENLAFSNDLPQTVTGREVVLLVPPSQVMAGLIRIAAPHFCEDALIISASKGIETETLRMMSEVLEDELPAARHEGLTFLSGPSFAKEVASGMPTAVVVASRDPQQALRAQQIMSTESFRTYTNNDIIGVELGGALKNVIALAAGVADGLGFGYNSRAALITRGLAEITRLGIAKGASPDTFAGLAGMGDLVLTCTGDLSRNRSVGIELGRGRSLEEIMSGMNMVVEGVKTTLATYRLASKLGVDVPITEQMYKILYEGKPPRQAVSDLMARDLKGEGF